MSVERSWADDPRLEIGLLDLSVAELGTVIEVRHWGCLEATGLMNGKGVKPKTFQEAYIASMGGIWDRNEARLLGPTELHFARRAREFLPVFRRARAYSERSDAAFFRNKLLIP